MVRPYIKAQKNDDKDAEGNRLFLQSISKVGSSALHFAANPEPSVFSFVSVISRRTLPNTCGRLTGVLRRHLCQQ
ncbi:hypothetical protein AGR4A_pAt10160 [Agrobacterium tumefaciens str. B6]|uniref:Uncharacterized protein n=1 Tax=Agrobacterium tumefaciens str. B6 TaxID=1183423 RepID=A0A822VCF6_AGRTU|nr:hypothetical protein AGR4A_pAt10160 [Agrobacterium tumefaciens str. B6]